MRIVVAYKWTSDPEEASYPVEAFQTALLEASRDGALLAYAPAEGDRRLRVALSEHVRARGVRATPDDFLVTRRGLGYTV